MPTWRSLETLIRANLVESGDKNLSWSEFEKEWRRGIEVGSRGDFFEEFYQGGDN